MKQTLYKSIVVIAFCLLFPTAFTLFVSRNGTASLPETKSSGRTITLKDEKLEMDMEDFIPCVLVNQLSIDSPPEAIKAQAVIIRTYILHFMGNNNSINASELDLPYTLYEDLKDIVEDDFSNYYTLLKKAVASTSGEVITYNDQIIVPYFHQISSGKTRNGNEALASEDYPYLVSKESIYDTSAQTYLDIIYVDKSDFIKILKEQRPEIVISADNPLENMQVLSRCSADYISEIQLGDQIFTGDQIQMIFSLKSPHFEMENFEDQIRVICKGNGHGLGLSIFGSTKMAEEDKSYKDILTYYYTDVVIKK